MTARPLSNAELAKRLGGMPSSYPRGTLKAARMAALADAEDYEDLLHAIERLGQQLKPGTRSLGNCRDVLVPLAARACCSLAGTEFSLDRDFHTPAADLFDIVCDERNAAQHVGARARGLVDHLTQFSLALEDGLLMKKPSETPVSDFMVRDVVYAELRHPVSFMRQSMLEHQFSVMPVLREDGWHFVRDVDLAWWLADDREKLVRRLRDAFTGEGALATVSVRALKLEVLPTEFVKVVLQLLAAPERSGLPALVVAGAELRGIVTAHDLL